MVAAKKMTFSVTEREQRAGIHCKHNIPYIVRMEFADCKESASKQTVLENAYV